MRNSKPHMPDRGYAEVGRSFRYAPAVGQTFPEMQDAVRKTELYRLGDANLVWVNEGDFWMLPHADCSSPAKTPPAPADNRDLTVELRHLATSAEALTSLLNPHLLPEGAAQQLETTVHQIERAYSALSATPSPADNGLDERIENAKLSMSETSVSWESRCHAIMAALGINYGRIDEFLPDEDPTPSPIEDVAEPSETLPIKLAKLRFFRDMIDAERAKVFAAFFGPQIAAEATTLGYQSMLFDRMFAARRVRPSPVEEPAPIGYMTKVGFNAWMAGDTSADRHVLLREPNDMRVPIYASPVDEDEATAKRLADASDYSIQLQRIIEAICHDTPLREDSKTLHHYRMAEKFKAELDGTRTNLRHWREECGKLHAQEETLRSLLTYIREHDGNAPGDNPALCQQIDAALQSQRKG